MLSPVLHEFSHNFQFRELKGRNPLIIQTHYFSAKSETISFLN